MKIRMGKNEKVQMQNMRDRYAQLQNQMVILQGEKALMERENEVRQMMAEIHPSKKATALRAIENVIGGFQKELRGTPESRAKRRAKFRKISKKFVAKVKEQKRKMELEEKRARRKRGY